jgi:hypothetical protein
MKIITLRLLFPLIYILLQGCAFTWTGYKIGKDADKGNFEEGPNSRIQVVPPNQVHWGGNNFVEIHKTDSTVLVLPFEDYELESLESYKARYDHFRDSVSGFLILPELGQTVIFSRASNPDKLKVGLFEGFTMNGLLIKTGIRYPYPLENLLMISDTLDYQFNLQSITDLYNENVFPNRTSVMLKTDDKQIIKIPLDQISYARCQRNDMKGKATGFLIGGAMDVALTVLIWTAIINSFPD